MSSATSTEFRLKNGPQAEALKKSDDADAGFRPWHFFILAALAASTIAVLMSRRSTPEHLILLSLTIAAAGAAAAGFYRMLAPLALEDVSVLDERPSERARAALEREKALVLRSIKELEFDRAMGKIAPKDFDEMGGRLRARAVMLMKQLDDGASAYREIIERELKTRMKSDGAGSALQVRDGIRDDMIRDGRAGSLDPATARSEDRALQQTSNAAPGTTAACACGTVNDADAAFCKRCGTKLETVQS